MAAVNWEDVKVSYVFKISIMSEPSIDNEGIQQLWKMFCYLRQYSFLVIVTVNGVYGIQN